MFPMNLPWPFSGTTIRRPSMSYVQLTNRLEMRIEPSPVSFSRFILKRQDERACNYYNIISKADQTLCRNIIIIINNNIISYERISQRRHYIIMLYFNITIINIITHLFLYVRSTSRSIQFCCNADEERNSYYIIRYYNYFQWTKKIIILPFTEIKIIGAYNIIICVLRFEEENIFSQNSLRISRVKYRLSSVIIKNFMLWTTQVMFKNNIHLLKN